MTAHPLPSSLDTAAAAPLRLELLAQLAAGGPVVLDGSGVTRVGQACLQVLASARASAAGHGFAFAIADASTALREMASLAGVDAVLEPLAAAGDAGR